MPGIIGYYIITEELLAPFAVLTNPTASQTVAQPFGVSLTFYDVVNSQPYFTLAQGGSISGSPVVGFSVLSNFTFDSAANNLELGGIPVVITGPVGSGQVLTYNGTDWVNGAGASGGVTSLNTLTGALTIAAGTDISVTPSGGNKLTIAYTGSAGGVTSLNALTGALSLTSTGLSVSISPSGTSIDLEVAEIDGGTLAGSAFDFTLPLSSGQFLKFNGTDWVNAAGSGSAGVTSLQGLAGDLTLTSTGGSITITPSSPDIDLEVAELMGGTLDGVAFDFGSLSSGDVLTYNGSDWVNAPTAATGVTSLNTLTGALALTSSGTTSNISISTSGSDVVLQVAHAPWLGITDSYGTFLDAATAAYGGIAFKGLSTTSAATGTKALFAIDTAKTVSTWDGNSWLNFEIAGTEYANFGYTYPSSVPNVTLAVTGSATALNINANGATGALNLNASGASGAITLSTEGANGAITLEASFTNGYVEEYGSGYEGNFGANGYDLTGDTVSIEAKTGYGLTFTSHAQFSNYVYTKEDPEVWYDFVNPSFAEIKAGGADPSYVMMTLDKTTNAARDTTAGFLPVIAGYTLWVSNVAALTNVTAGAAIQAGTTVTAGTDFYGEIDTTSLGGVDFSFSGISSGDVLYYNGSDWINTNAAALAPVQSVSNSDGSLSISPTTGAVVASLNVGNANSWTAEQTFTAGAGPNTSISVTHGADFSGYGITISAGSNGAFRIANPAATYMYFIHPAALAQSTTLTLPLCTAATDSLAAVGTAQTWTATQTYTPNTPIEFTIGTNTYAQIGISGDPSSTDTASINWFRNNSNSTAFGIYNGNSTSVVFSVSSSGNVNASGTATASSFYGEIDTTTLDGVAFSFTSLSSGDLLSYNGSNWVNAALSSAVVTSLNSMTGALTVNSPNSTLNVNASSPHLELDINLNNGNTWTATQTFNYYNPAIELPAPTGGGSSNSPGIAILGYTGAVSVGVNLYVNDTGTFVVGQQGSPYSNLFTVDQSGNVHAGGDVYSNDYFYGGNASLTGGRLIIGKNSQVGAIQWYSTPGDFDWLDADGAGTSMALYTAAVTIAAGYTLSIAAVSNSSDSRLKPDWTDYPNDPFAELDAVRVGQYRHMGTPENMADLGSYRAGVAAETLPATVNEYDPEGWAHVRSPDSFAWSVVVMKALRDKVRNLETEVASLRATRN
jgi:hypothetical protein